MNTLSPAELMQAAPSIFSEEPSPRVSGDYKQIRTFDIVKDFGDIGYLPVMAKQTRVRRPGATPYAKHMLKFVHKGSCDHDGGLPQILMVNSHEGTSSYQLHLAMHIFACGNGLIIMSGQFASHRVRHQGDKVAEQVIQASNDLHSQVDRLLTYTDEWKDIQLTPEQEIELATDMLRIRYGDPAKAPILPFSLTYPRRGDDEGHDLWSVFNRVQENVMKGGVTSGLRGPRRQLTTRPIRGVSEDFRFNTEAWKAAEAVYNKLMGKVTATEIEVA